MNKTPVQKVKVVSCVPSSSCIYVLPQKGDLAIYYELGEGEDPRKRGIVEVDHTTGR